MTWRCHRKSKTGGPAPATLGFNAVAPEWLNGAADAAPAVPAAESTLGSHPCVALSSAQVFPEWMTSTSLCNTFSTDGDYPFNFVSHPKGSLHCRPFPRTPFSATGALPPLRSGQVFLDEAEHFLHNRGASVATLRWCSGSSRNAVRNHPGFSVRLRRNPQRLPCLSRDFASEGIVRRSRPSNGRGKSCAK